MGVRVLHDREERSAALYCSTCGWAFGPLFSDRPDQCLDADDNASGFLVWLHDVCGLDPRPMSDPELTTYTTRWFDALDKIGPTSSELGDIVRLAVDYDTAATMRVAP